MISIVMPAYNCEKYISEAIESVLKQTYCDWELLIVDDCSADGTARIAEQFAENDSRIKLIKQPQNGGVARARNTGVAMAKGEYIAFLDSDDMWCEDKLEKQIKLQEESGAAVIYSSYDFIDEDGNMILKPYIVPPKTDYSKMLHSNVVGCSTLLADTQILKKHPFSTDFYHEDYVLWMELMSIPVKAVGNTEVLSHYRLVKGSRSDNKKNAAKQRWNIYRNALNLGFVKSCIAFVMYGVSGVIKYYL